MGSDALLIWEKLGYFGLGLLALVLVIVWGVKYFAGLMFQNEVAKYKSQLDNARDSAQRDHERDLETLRAEYALKASEIRADVDRELEEIRHHAQLNSFKSNSAYEKQMVVIEELHLKLLELMSILGYATRGVWMVPEKQTPAEAKQERVDRVNKCHEKHMAFNDYYLKNQIWIPEQISIALDELRRSSGVVLSDLGFNEEWRDAIPKEAWEKFKKAQEDYRKKCLPNSDLIVKLFRSHFLPVKEVVIVKEGNNAEETEA